MTLATHTHRFCENWLYSICLVFVLKHALIEPFRIPSASMEPMMFGDPSILRGDMVVVDKLTQRWRPYERFDVAVFQFPIPELEWPGDARPAVDELGRRIDHPLLAPLYGRNFVKRIVGMPGDEFYIRGGNLFLRGGDGAFHPATKPVALQDALWTATYRHGDQAGYVPWTGSGGSQVAAAGAGLRVDLPPGGRAVFAQALNNLYLKAGEVRVEPISGRGDAAKVRVSMTQPLFTLGGVTGNLYDLDRWRFTRLQSKDLDNWQVHGTELNGLMNEHVADVRLTLRATAVTGAPALGLDLPGVGAVRLVLDADGWRATRDDDVIAQGAGSLGRRLALCHVDGHLIVQVDGAEVARIAVPAFDSERLRASVVWSGTGSATLDLLTIERDLHWSRRGFLADGTAERAANTHLQTMADTAMGRAKATRDLALMASVRADLVGVPVASLTSPTIPVASSPERPGRIPADCYLLLGDNSPHSWDGRNWGLVPGINLRGRAVARVFPPKRIGAVE
jgi:signal peptidase I